jgi:hypothetical protein
MLNRLKSSLADHEQLAKIKNDKLEAIREKSRLQKQKRRQI